MGDRGGDRAPPWDSHGLVKRLELSRFQEVPRTTSGPEAGGVGGGGKGAPGEWGEGERGPSPQSGGASLGL